MEKEKGRNKHNRKNRHLAKQMGFHLSEFPHDVNARDLNLADNARNRKIKVDQYDELKRRQKPFIFKKTVKPYDDGKQFGHEFTLEIGIKSPHYLLWLEKTNKPYLSEMRENEWNNMATIGEGSNVFKNWEMVDGSQNYEFVTFVDPPSIKKTPNNFRRLEFYIHIFGNEEKDMIVLEALQELRTNANGDIETSEFSFQEEKVYQKGSSENIELTNPFWGD
jgi:hypothetical protein